MTKNQGYVTRVYLRLFQETRGNEAVFHSTKQKRLKLGYSQYPPAAHQIE